MTPGSFVAAAAIAALMPGAAAAQGLAYVGGLQLATGSYVFQTRTTGVALSNGLDATLGPLRLTAAIPLIAQNTPWISYAGGTVIPSGGPEHDVASRQGMGAQRMHAGGVVLPDTARYDAIGFGDPMVSAALDVMRGFGQPNVRLTAGLKVPLSRPDNGFGTGEWDYGAGVSVSAAAGLTLIFLDAQYWVLGDFPNLRLDDTGLISFGVGRPLGSVGGWAGLLSLAAATPSVDGVSAPVQVGVGLSRGLVPGRTLALSAAVGLTDSAPDLSLASSWRVAF